MTTLSTIHAEHVLRHPPERVWAALTDPAKMSRWLMPTDLRPVLGAKFTLDAGQWGIVHGEVLAIEAPRRLAIAWRNPPLDTTVTWTLIPEGAGTRLVLDHAGFDLDDPRQRMAWDGMRAGWQGAVSERFLAAVAES
jgi:uncharacterized protein YndB with AHSA1/START domain